MQARAALLLLLWAASAEDKAMRTLSIGTTGVAVQIRQGPAFDQLFTWSKHLGDRDKDRRRWLGITGVSTGVVDSLSQLRDSYWCRLEAKQGTGEPEHIPGGGRDP